MGYFFSTSSTLPSYLQLIIIIDKDSYPSRRSPTRTLEHKHTVGISVFAGHHNLLSTPPKPVNSLGGSFAGNRVFPAAGIGFTTFLICSFGNILSGRLCHPRLHLFGQTERQFYHRKDSGFLFPPPLPLVDLHS